MIAATSNAQVYTLCRLLVTEVPQAPGDRRGCVRCTSRRRRLLVYTGEEAPPQRCHPRGRMIAAGHTATSNWRCEYVYTLSRGPKKERSAQFISGRFRFGFPLLVDRAPLRPCHSATNELPVMNVFGGAPLYTVHLSWKSLHNNRSAKRSRARSIQKEPVPFERHRLL